MHRIGIITVLALAFALGTNAMVAGQDQRVDRGQIYQAVITKSPEMTIRNGHGEFTVVARRGKVGAYRRDSSSELSLIKSGSVYQAVDDSGSRLLIFAVYGAGSYGTQIVYPHHADASNSRARIGLTAGGLAEVATMEDQHTLLKERSRSLGVDPDQALFVKSVAAGSLADRVGLKFGDVILQVGDTVRPSALQFQHAVFEAAAGSVLPLTVVNLEGERVHELVMPAVPDPVDPIALDKEIREVLKTSATRN